MRPFLFSNNYIFKGGQQVDLKHEMIKDNNKKMLVFFPILLIQEIFNLVTKYKKSIKNDC